MTINNTTRGYAVRSLKEMVEVLCTRVGCGMDVAKYIVNEVRDNDGRFQSDLYGIQICRLGNVYRISVRCS